MWRARSIPVDVGTRQIRCACFANPQLSALPQPGLTLGRAIPGPHMLRNAFAGRLRLLAAVAGLAGLSVTPAAAQDASWLANPGSADFYTGSNWSPASVPTGTATFGTSATTALTLGTTGSVGGWTFNAGASNYTFNMTAATTFTGAGIAIAGGSATITVGDEALTFTNNSSAGSATINYAKTSAFAPDSYFRNSSTAGSATININGQNRLNFVDTSTAGNATITIDNTNGYRPYGSGIMLDNNATLGNSTVFNNGYIYFQASTSAGSATIINSGAYIFFYYSSTAGNATITNNTSLNFWSDASAGTAHITNAVGGTLDVVNRSTLANATVINSGQMSFWGGNPGDVPTAGNATITNNATGAIELRNAATLGNATITNAGTIVFNNSATAGNASIVNNNQLTFYGLTSAGSAVITNSGTILFDGNSTAASAQLTNTAPGAVVYFYTPGPASDGRITAGSLAGNGSFDLGGIELTVGGNNLSTTVTGVLTGYGIATGTSLIKTGTGTLTLAGINTYTGATLVDDGNLVVNGSIASSSSLTINNGGTLGGNGTVGNTAINGGTLAPGNSIGLLTVQGNLVLTAASRYMVEVSPANADRVNVTGTANLGGATVNASFAQGSYLNKRYTIVNATGGLGSTTFSALVNSNLPANVTTSLSYDTNNAYLDLKLDFVPPPDTGLGKNQSGVGNALVDFFNRNGGIPLVYSGLTASGLTQASGETATGGQQTTFNAMTQFMGSMTDTFAAGRDGGAPGAMGFADDSNASAAAAAKSQSARNAYAMFTKAPPVQSYDPRWSMWASGIGGSQTTDGNSAAGSNTSTSRIYGVAAGADYRLSRDTIAGFAMAGGGTNFSVTGGGSGRSDLFQIGGFVRHAIGATYLSGALAYGWQDVTTDRTVISDQLQARFNANTFSGRFEAGHRVATSWLGGLGLTPYAAAQVTTIALPAYAETVLSGSNAFALSYSGKTVTGTRSELGLRTDKSFALDGALLTLRGRAAWAHGFNIDRAASATFIALPGASFVVNGAAPARDAVLTTASAEVSFLNGISLAATFEGEFSQVTRSYAGKGVVRYAW